jgi:acetyl-CoA carboxylase biotin carboxyl carrier protein
MDISKVKELIGVMEESDLAELEIREGDESVRIVRGGAQAMVAPAVAPMLSLAETVPEAEDAAKPMGHIVRAPMVGTFYRAPSPESPTFAEVGARVREGDTLCIIESMKMMNEVLADASGTIEAILVANDTAVEFDQPIFTIV